MACTHCGKHHLDYAVETESHDVRCPQWNNLWATMRHMLHVLDVGATLMRQWFVYYGPESLTPIQVRYHLHDGSIILDILLIHAK